MLLSIFKKSYYIQIVWVVFIGILLAIPSFLYDHTLQGPDHTIFLKITELPAILYINWIYNTLSWLLLFGLAFYVKALLTKHQLVHHLNFLPAIIILALFGFQQPFSYPLTSITCLYFISFAFSFLLKSFQDERPDNSIFSAALLIGIASLLSYNITLFLVLVWISFFVFQNYSWRYLPITIVGFLVPYVFLLTWLYWFDQMSLIEQEYDLYQKQLYIIPHFKNLFDIIIISILGFFIFVSLARIIPEIPGKIISIRKKTSLSLWFLILSLIPFAFSPELITKNIFLIPLSGFLGYYLRLVKRRRIFIDFLFTILIFLLILHKYYSVYVTETFF